ncbi:MAG: hypothetical protein ACYCXG_12485 [Acidiferrobacter sp.]
MSHVRIVLEFDFSPAFLGLLGALNGYGGVDPDNPYDWADQTTDFLRGGSSHLPPITAAGLETPLSRQVMQEAGAVYTAILGNDVQTVRGLLADVRFLFIVGYPRTGGSYLTKELLRALGLNHKTVPEDLAHDGYPDLSPHWFTADVAPRTVKYLQNSLLQLAEFLVISKHWYRQTTQPLPDGRWLVPKKFHKVAYWGGNLRMLLAPNHAQYVVTVRHPVPTCLSVIEKSGGWERLHERRFPGPAARSTIEHWIARDLQRLGYDAKAQGAMDYFDAFLQSWRLYHEDLRVGGLWHGDSTCVRRAEYGKAVMEGLAGGWRRELGVADPTPEPFYEAPWQGRFPEWERKAAEQGYTRAAEVGYGRHRG